MSKKTKKESEKPVKLFTLDTETRGLFGDIFRVGLYTGDKYYATNTFKQLKSIMKQYTEKYDCHIFIHNLDFDLSKLAEDVLPNADLKNSIFINNNVTVFSTSINDSQTREEKEIISQPITFHDSNKLIMGRLKKICKDFGIEEKKAKIELKDHILELGWGRNRNGEPITDEKEYDEFESEGYYFMNVDPYEKELNEYLRNDCISLYEIMKTLIKLSNLPLGEFLKCPTTASLAMKVFQFNYEEDYERATSTNYLGKWGSFTESVVRDAYYGGRTEVFQPILKGGYHYDVNSLYPYVMKVNKIPFGQARHHEGEKAENVFRYWLNYRQGGGFLEVDIYIPENIHIPPLPAKREKKLMFPVGKLHGVWTFEEIELALEVGCKIEQIYQCIYFEKTDFIFKRFVEKYEKIKNESEGAKRTFAKLMQNSLYGKFGMKRIRETLLPASHKTKCEEKGYTYVEYTHPFMDEEFIEAKIPSYAKYIQPHVAAYVTSHARILLYKGLIAQHKKGEVAYCDTDSVACSETFDPEMVHSKEYGKWKLESVLEEGIFIQPKTYYERSKPIMKEIKKEIPVMKDGYYRVEEVTVKKELIIEETKKFKGVPNKYVQPLTRHTYMDIVNKLKELQVRSENGEKIKKEDAYYSIYKGEKKRIKFATTLKNGVDNFDLFTEVSKGILLINRQKRKMDYINNKTFPHAIYDYGESWEAEQLDEAMKEWENEFKEYDDIKEKVKMYGYIKIPEMGDQYYYEYQDLNNSVRKKYFRKNGLALDVWCKEANEDPALLMDELRGY